jgi:hypothetical protein
MGFYTCQYGCVSDADCGQALEAIVRLTVREGCIGETIAAIEAAEARATTQEPHIRAVLGCIQSDELRHAALAWRFVQWALAEDAANPNRAATRPLRDVVREARPLWPSWNRVATSPLLRPSA